MSCKQCCSEHWGACILSNHDFLWIYTQEWLLDHMVALVFISYGTFILFTTVNCISLHPHQWCRRDPFTSHPLYHLLFVDFLMMGILTGLRWYLIAVLIYVPLTVRNVECLFMCCLAICMAGWHPWLDGHESEWTPGFGDGQGGLACCDSWGRKESDMTERLNWTEADHFWEK